MLKELIKITLLKRNRFFFVIPFSVALHVILFLSLFFITVKTPIIFLDQDKSIVLDLESVSTNRKINSRGVKSNNNLLSQKEKPLNKNKKTPSALTENKTNLLKKVKKQEKNLAKVNEAGEKKIIKSKVNKNLSEKGVNKENFIHDEQNNIFNDEDNQNLDQETISDLDYIKKEIEKYRNFSSIIGNNCEFVEIFFLIQIDMSGSVKKIIHLYDNASSYVTYRMHKILIDHNYRAITLASPFLKLNKNRYHFWKELKIKFTH